MIKRKLRGNNYYFFYIFSTVVILSVPHIPFSPMIISNSYSSCFSARLNDKPIVSLVLLTPINTVFHFILYGELIKAEKTFVATSITKE